ncbi:MAG: serine/threonine-protein phosphatase [Planctomycetota bacterium]|nr:MAG: serine/threonine-protein phosphatase [Planctomycetota bacterium]
MSAPAAPGEPGPITLHCAEVWGGNAAVNTAVSTTGLDVWVYSEPYAGAAGGGDVYYLTLCMQGCLARFALADVSGHGEGVDALARTLRRQVRRNVNRADQAGIARALNRSFGELARMGQYATALLATYDAGSDHLIVCNAGHPRPMLRRAGQAGWAPIDAGSPAAVTDATGGASGLPLGVIDDTDYAQFAIPLAPGDEVMMYTDALIEGRGADGRQLGEDGLADLLDGVAVWATDRLIPQTLQRLRQFRAGGDPEDDLTVIAMRHNAAGPLRLNLLERARTLSRLLGL